MAEPSIPTVLLVPGLKGSCPAHWQSRWARLRSDCTVVRQDDWENPQPADWTARLDEVIAAAFSPVVLVAHSLGCATVAHWAASTDPSRVAAALLVAPCDVDQPDACDALRRFAPMPGAALPFRSTVVASRDDPYADFARLKCFAERWGSAFVDVGPLGHINANCALGDWDFGQVLLDDLLTVVGDDRNVRDDRHVRAAALRSGNPAPCFDL